MSKKIIASVILMFIAALGVFGSYAIAASGSSSDSDDEIDSYEDCVDAGYPIQETAPPRCMTNDGTTFVQGRDEPIYAASGSGSGSVGGVASTYNKYTTIIYGPKDVPQISLDKYKAHCVSVGGTFNSCGSLCSDGDACVKVCALTCENVPVKEDADSIYKIKSKESSVEIEYKSDDSKYKVKYADGDEYEFESEFKIKKMIEAGIRFESSDGTVRTVNVLPDAAVAKAFDSDLSDVKIKIKEKIYKNVPKVVYNIEGESEGRFLGIFKIRERYKAEVDANTGEVLNWKGPWWAFLITGEVQPTLPAAPAADVEPQIEVTDYESCVKVTGISTDGIPSECTYNGVVYTQEIEVIDEVKVTDFSACVAAGNPVMESYPRQCMHDGFTYVEFDTVPASSSASAVDIAGIAID